MNRAQRILGLFLLATAALAPAAARAEVVLKASSKGFSANGGSGSVSYTITNAAPSPLSGTVAVSTDQGWITNLSGGGAYTVAPGKKATGSVKFRVAKNEGVAARQGAISIADKTFTVTQAGAPCKLAISPAARSVTKDGAQEASLAITATAGCGWEVTSGAAWISVEGENAAGTGTGAPQTISYAVSANDAMKPRTGKIYVETTAAKPQKKTHTVKQAAQTMGSLPGIYAGVSEGTLVRIDVSDKGNVTGSIENVWGDVWALAGTLSPLGSLTATGTLKKGQGSAITLEGSEDGDGNLAVTGHWTENGVPRSGTLTLAKKAGSATAARYSFATSAGVETGGVFDVAADATVSGLLVNAWSETYVFRGLITANGRLVGLGQGTRVLPKDPSEEDSLFFVASGSYDGGASLTLTVTSIEDGDEQTFEIGFAKTSNPFVGVYGGTFSGSSPGDSVSGVWKVGVNADGGVEGYAVGKGDDESHRIGGTIDVGTGDLSLTLYEDDGGWVEIGTLDGSVGSDGKWSATFHVPEANLNGTLTGGKLR